jgi:uncharacterized protein (TIGR02145 family)
MHKYQNSTSYTKIIAMKTLKLILRRIFFLMFSNLFFISPGTYGQNVYSDLTSCITENMEFTGYTNEVGTSIQSQDEINSRRTVAYASDLFTNCPRRMTDPRDGNTYSVILIGNQCWMEKNLAYLPSVSPPNQGSFTSELYYVYGYWGVNVNEAKNTQNYQSFGALYNWPAALTACPPGWFLPSDEDFCQLTQFLDNTVNCSVFGFSGTDAGIQMKSTSGWSGGGNGTNESGYNANAAGYRSFFGNTFWHMNQISEHWSSDELTGNDAIGRELHNLYNNIKRYVGRKDYGFSVRCLKKRE